MSWEDALGSLIRRRLGLSLRIERGEGAVQRFVEARQQVLGLPDPAKYMNYLYGSDEEFERLVSVVTNGFTFFFRSADQLSAVVELASGLGRRARIWSAGCATGEEVWSLAALLSLRGVSASILGTDVDGRGVAIAREGRYPQSALKRIPELLRPSFIKRGATVEVSPTLRQMVRFDVHNLVREAPPAPLVGQVWDVVICRNVLIHFTPAAVEAAGRALLGRLAPDGVVVLGAAEPEIAGLRPHLVGRDLVWTRGARPRVDPAPRPSLPPVRLEPERRPPKVERALPAPAELSVSELLTRGNAALAAHDFDEARRQYSRAHRKSPLTPEVHVLAGVLERKTGDTDRAVESLRGALFLDPDHWPAAFLLAGLYRRLGDDSGAARLMRRARACAPTRTLESLFSSQGYDTLVPTATQVLGGSSPDQLRA